MTVKGGQAQAPLIHRGDGAYKLRRFPPRDAPLISQLGRGAYKRLGNHFSSAPYFNVRQVTSLRVGRYTF